MEKIITSRRSFGNHVPRFELVRSDGSKSICSVDENPEMYHATIGGMGLTGLITWAEVQLRPIASRKIRYTAIKFSGIDEFLSISNSSRSECTMAWIDCISQGRAFARGIYMQGDYSEVLEPKKASPKPRLAVPFDFPSWALNRTSMRLFNELYYRKQLRRQVTGLIDYEPFFYPLDSVPALESHLRQARLFAISMCHPLALWKRWNYRDSRNHRGVRHGILSGRVEGDGGDAFRRIDVVSAAWHHPCARYRA